MFSQDQWSLEDPAKRRLAMQMLCSGALGAMPFGAAQAFWFGSKTDELSDDKSIFTLKGDVRVNDAPVGKIPASAPGTRCAPATTARSCSRSAEIHS